MSLTSSGTYNVVITVSDGSLTDTDPFTWTVTDGEVALNFDGVNDYVSFGNATGLGTATFTLEAWIRRDAAGAATSTGTGGVTAVPIVTKGRAEADGSNVDANYFLGIDANNHLIGDFEDAATGLNHPVTGTIAIPVSTTTWHHVAGTYDGTTWRLYVDGVLDTTLAVGNFTPRADSIQHAGLGTAMTSTGLADGFFAGRMDEVRIWSVARSTAEIQATRNVAITGPRNKLLARYGFDEASGTIVGDSASEFDGNAINGPTWVLGTALSPASANVAPVFSTDITDQSNTEGNIVSLDADASDSNFDSLTYSATGLPSGTTINATTGVISGTLSSTSSGSHFVTVTVSDGFLVATDTFTWTVSDPPSGSALDFDGIDDHVTFGAAPNLNSNTFTIETWFRRDGAGTPASTSGSPGGVTAIPLVTKGLSESGQLLNWFLGIDSATSRIAADFESASDDSNHGIVGTTTLVNGTWYHAAATYDGTTFRLYLNGVQEASVAVAAGPGTGSLHHAALGTAMTSTGAPTGRFDGAMDEIRIWNVARSAAQLNARRDQELLSGAGLIARYGLAEATGTVINNSVATAGTTGTAVGGPAWVGGAPVSAPANAGPVFSTDITNQSHSEGAVISLSPAATDADADTLTYSATNLPNGITINTATGRHHRHPELNQLGHLQRRHQRLRRLIERDRSVHLDGRRRGRGQHGARLRRHQRLRHLRRRGQPRRAELHRRDLVPARRCRRGHEHWHRRRRPTPSRSSPRAARKPTRRPT